MTNGHPPEGGQPQPEGYPPGQPQPGAYPQYPQQQEGYGQYPQAPGSYQGGPSGPRASFWQRLGAYLLDVLIVFVPLLIVLGLLGTFDDLGDDSNQFQNFDDGTNVAITLIGLVAMLSYFSLLEGSPSGQTVGKKALGIRVIDQQTAGSIGVARALGRNSVRALPSYLPLFGWLWGLLDHLWMLWDKENQALHDKVVKTFVVPVAAYPIQITDPGHQQSFGQRFHQQGNGGQPPGHGPPPDGSPPPGPPPDHNPHL